MPVTDPATVAKLAAMRRRGALSDEAYREAVRLVTASPSEAEWLGLMRGGSLGLGVFGVVGALTYFAVVNWWELGGIGQSLLVQALFVAAAVAGARLGADRLAGRLSLAAAAGLIGPVLFVIAAAWPSEGELWTLLLLWFALMTPFVAAARFAPLLVGWLAVANMTWLSLADESDLFQQMPGSGTALGLFDLNLLGLALWEWQALRRPWMTGRWAPRLIGAWTVTTLVIAALPTVWVRGDGVGWPALAIMVALTGAFQWRYWRGGRDLMLAATTLIAGVFVLGNAASRLVFEVMSDTLFVLVGVPVVGGVVVVSTVAALAWLRLGLVRPHEAV